MQYLLPDPSPGAGGLQTESHPYVVDETAEQGKASQGERPQNLTGLNQKSELFPLTIVLNSTFLLLHIRRGIFLNGRLF